MSNTAIRLVICLMVFVTICYSCDRVKDKVKTTVNQGGETVGKTATEFVEGVTEGVYQTLECKVVLSDALKAKGLSTGKFGINSSTNGGNNNQLNIYFIAEQDYSGSIRIKVTDKNGIEGGRLVSTMNLMAGEAGYQTFEFDKLTYIESKSIITIEQQ